MGSKTEVIQPNPPAAVSPGQSAADHAKALPSILQTHLQYQPQFDQQTFDSFAQLAPEYARVARETQEEFDPNLVALGDQLSAQALEGSQQGIPDDLRQQYASDFKSLAGNQVNSGLGADFVSRNLLAEDLAYRQFNQNLGLSLSNKVPVANAFQAPSQFNVANSFAGAYGTQQSGNNAFIAGSRPMLGTPGQSFTQGFADVAGGVGGLLQGLNGFKMPGG